MDEHWSCPWPWKLNQTAFHHPLSGLDRSWVSYTIPKHKPIPLWWGGPWPSEMAGDNTAVHILGKEKNTVNYYSKLSSECSHPKRKNHHRYASLYSPQQLKPTLLLVVRNISYCGLKVVQWLKHWNYKHLVSSSTSGINVPERCSFALSHTQVII